MSQNRFSLKLIAGITVALFVGVALYLRIAFSYDQVFSGDWIKFASHDAYHYMRLVDNLVHNFPHLINFDPYMRYPQGLQLGSLNLFVYLLSGIIWLVGLGSPTQHTVDIVGVYFPAIVGALTVIPVYFIGKTLFNRWAGVLSAGLVAILSGEFLGRTKLGFTDRDAVEVLLTALTMLFLILAIKSACQKQLTFNHLKRRDWPVVTKPLIYSLLAGVFLGIYLLTWKGAFLFVIIIFVYFIIQYIIDHFGHKSTGYLCFVGTITFSIALIIFWTASPSQVYLAPLVIGLLTPLVLTGVSWLMVKRRIKPAYYPLTMIGLSMVGLVILHIINPSLLSAILGSLGRIFAQPATELTILESQPILFHGGKFSFLPIWGNFTTGFFLSFISLGILIYLTIKRGEADKTLFIVWSLVILVFTLAMRRFALLFVVNVALLAGYLSILVYYVIRFIIGYLSGNSTDYMSGRFLELAGFKTMAAKPVEVLRKWGYYDVLGVPRNATDKQIKRAFRELTFKYRPGRDRADIAEERFKEINKAYEVLSDRHKRAAYDRSEYGMAKREKGKARRKRGGFNITTNHINMALAVIAVFFLAFFPNIGPAVVTASQARFAPSDGWVESLSWLKDNTPDPFGDPDFYYDLYETPFHYPETAYGVVAWWDYGYWIVRIGHRLPNCDPGGGARGRVGRFFTAQDEASASQMIDKLNSRYIIIDRATVTSKFYAVATYAGSSEEEFPDIYYQAQKGMMVPVPLLYPEYYRSLAVRLYNFDGGEVTPQSSTVISYKEKVRWDGMPYKEIVNEKSFSSYEEAEAYVLSQKSENYKIVSNNPFISPVPLKALEHYKLIYSSASCIMQPGVGMIPEVKIFEYTQ